MLNKTVAKDYLQHMCDRVIANFASEHGLKEYQVAAILNQRSR